MTGEPATSARPATPRGWVRALLIGSLALNFLVLGVVGGSLIRDHRRGPPPSAVRELGFGPFSDALTDTDRAALRKSWLARAPDLRGARRDMRADLADVETALRALPFDPAALQAALARGADRARMRRELGQSLMLDRIATMSGAERAAFADRLETAMKTRKGHRGPRPSP